VIAPEDMHALEEANEAFRALASGELARGLIMF
jgi:hypothetical protein